MQSASSNFTQEISGGNVVWAPPRVFTDWDRTGYGADGTIDDLSAQVGDSFTIAHHLDDGMPEQVSFVSGLGSPTLDAPLVYGRSGQRASTYFSPFNTTSPVSGFDRDVAPVKLDWGVITVTGKEYVRLFTGQMMNIPVKGQAADLQAMSATRNKLRKLIQPPAINGNSRGLNATWLIVWALAQCGLYVSPPPRTGCRFWAPMHGSLAPMLPSVSFDDDPGMKRFTVGGPTGGVDIRPRFIPGPYMFGTDCAVTPSEVRRSTNFIYVLGSGADILSKAGSTGRIEFWVKGDPANFNTAPGGSGNYPSQYVYFGYQTQITPFAKVEFGIQNDRRAFLNIIDGSGTTWTAATTNPLPTDGNWYFVGGSWDLANSAGSVMAIRQFDGTTTYYGAGPTTTNLPVSDRLEKNNPTPAIQAFLPISEVQLSTGPSVGLSTAPAAPTWIVDAGYAWSVGATIRPSILELVALAETTPRETWALLGSLAQGELATMRTDELDRFNYLPMSYWAESAQQAVVDALSTSLNMADIDVDADPSKVFNVVSVDYSDTRIDPSLATLAFRETREIPPGKSTLKLALDKPALAIGAQRGDLLVNATASGVAAGLGSNCTINSSPDGTGTYRASDEVLVTLADWDPGNVTLNINNVTGATQYFANNGNGVPTVSMYGTTFTASTVSAVATDPTSITRRGERGLSVSLPAIQRRDNALSIARELAARLMKPRPVIGQVTLFPDPRRQPGDLVTLTDTVNTGASGLWRTQSITHTRSGSDYTQTATVRRAMPVAIEGVATEGDYTAGP